MGTAHTWTPSSHEAEQFHASLGYTATLTPSEAMQQDPAQTKQGVPEPEEGLWKQPSHIRGEGPEN